MNQRQTICEMRDRIDEAMAKSAGLTHLSPRGRAIVMDMQAELRTALALAERALSGPRVSRQRRIANEVAMTGYEQELGL